MNACSIVKRHIILSLVYGILMVVPWTLTALQNIELASFLRWYVAVELHDPAYAKRFYCTYEILEENMMKVRFHKFFIKLTDSRSNPFTT